MELDYFEEVEKLVDKEIITISDSIALKVIGKDSIKNIINLLNNLPELPSRSTLKGINLSQDIIATKDIDQRMWVVRRLTPDTIDWVSLYSYLTPNNYIMNITTFKSCYLELVRIGLYS